MKIHKLARVEKFKYESYQICLTPLDQRCNSLRIQIQDQNNSFQDTINIHDVIEIRKLLKQGKKMEQINSLSLLFVKLMISTSIASSKLKIKGIIDIPYQKIIKSKDEISQKWLVRGDNEDVKGLILQVKQNFFIILPRLLIQPPQWIKKVSKQQERQLRIKGLFYGSPKQ